MMNHGSVLSQFMVALAKYIQFCGTKILPPSFFLGFKQLNVIFLLYFYCRFIFTYTLIVFILLK